MGLVLAERRWGLGLVEVGERRLLDLRLRRELGLAARRSLTQAACACPRAWRAWWAIGRSPGWASGRHLYRYKTK